MTTLFSEAEADARVRTVLTLHLYKRKGIMAQLFKTADGNIVEVMETTDVDLEELLQDVANAQEALAIAEDRVKQFKELSGITITTQQDPSTITIDPSDLDNTAVPTEPAPIEQPAETPVPEQPAEPAQPEAPILQPTEIPTIQ